MPDQIPSFPPNFLEAPLEGLIDIPFDQMSDEQLRQQVIRMQELRASSQSLQAAFRGKTSKAESAQQKQINDALDEF